jgi:hypothetical protein
MSRRKKNAPRNSNWIFIFDKFYKTILDKFSKCQNYFHIFCNRIFFRLKSGLKKILGSKSKINFFSHKKVTQSLSPDKEIAVP